LLVIPAIQHVQGDRLEREMLRLTPKNAIDCGGVRGTTVENSTFIERDAADGCAVAAFEKGQPFRVRYDMEYPEAPDGKEIHS